MFEIVATYSFPRPTKVEMGESARHLHYDWLVNAKGEFAQQVQWDNLKHLGLVEARADRSFDIDRVVYHVVKTEQAPYLEFYLGAASNEVLWFPAAKRGNREQLPDVLRVCFFLHLLHPHLGSVFSPPTIKYGDFATRVIRGPRVPGYLRALARYVPVD